MNTSDEDKDLEGSSAQDGLRISGTSWLAASSMHHNGNDYPLRNNGDTGLLAGQVLDIEIEDLGDIEVPNDFDYGAYEAELD
ncbi:hypothetical protein MMC34_007530, partial [Xylographa carneopallida]|nr:hypothetical protein [Xylographa carneopallida]